MRATRSFTVILSNPSPGTTLANSTVPITITDDDVPVLGFTMNAASISEGGSIASHRSAIRPSAGAVSVDYATAPGTATEDTDYVSDNGTLTWADGDGEPAHHDHYHRRHDA